MKIITQWSVEDYHKMIEVGIFNNRQVELINREIIQMSPEGAMHRFINHRGTKYLRALLGEKAEVMEAHPITLKNSEPEPDITIVRPPDTLYLNRHPYPEDIYWLIEIADKTLTKDLGIKKKIYHAAGIQEYWIIDIHSQKLIVFQHPTQEDYQIEKNYSNGIIYSLAFPSLSISVDQLIKIG